MPNTAVRGLIRPSAPFTPAQHAPLVRRPQAKSIKAAYRRLSRAYDHTHALLAVVGGPVSTPLAIDAIYVAQAVDNLRTAEQLARQADTMPFSKRGKRLRRIALDNLDVAAEVVQVLANAAKRTAAA